MEMLCKLWQNSNQEPNENALIQATLPYHKLGNTGQKSQETILSKINI